MALSTGMNPSDAQSGSPKKRTDHVAGWIMSRVTHAREVRDQEHGKLWNEYTRLWRGKWSPEDKNRDSERSRLIAPALQQAIEMTVSEMEEATFGRTAWIDIDDDVLDEEKNDVIVLRDNLLEDYDWAKVPQALSDVFLLGSLYGTGIGKIHVSRQSRKETYRGESGKLKTRDDVRPMVGLEAVRPDEFVIDTAARNTDEALFCAHEMRRPLHVIKEKIRSGKYRDVPIGPYSGSVGPSPAGKRQSTTDDSVLITEYHGKVPRYFLGDEDEGDMDDLVEVIAWIANEAHTLKIIKNPYLNEDRAFIAYQHDTVPGQFWGRGVAEKGYNPQKALDAELRARIDALSLITAPMMGADVTRLPRNPDLRIRPGKVWLTRGKPSDILEPVVLGNLQPATFQQSGDFERMVQMGTGAIDSATPVNINRRNETASGMSQLNAAFIKRSKRTMQNLERCFIDPLVRKSLWRYMQYYPERYPSDFKFKVNATMGIMAKEFEQQQLTQMLGFVPPESKAHPFIIKAIFENSSSANKKDLMQALEAMTQPPSEEEQKMQQQIQELQMRAQQAEVAKTEAEAAKEQAEAQLALAKAERERILAQLEDDKVEIQAANAAVAAEQIRVHRANLGIQADKNNVEREKIKTQREVKNADNRGK